MQLAPATEKALERWIGPNTWHTGHPVDMNRFFDFVSQYQKDHGYTIEETALHQLVASKAGCIGNDALGREIRERISLAYNILDFLKQTGR